MKKKEKKHWLAAKVAYDRIQNIKCISDILQRKNEFNKFHTNRERGI